MGLYISLASKIASTNQRVINIKKTLGEDVQLKDYVLCFLKTNSVSSYHELFKYSIKLPDYILKQGDELRVYIGKGENSKAKINAGICYIIYWELDISLFDNGGIFYSLENIVRNDFKRGL